MAPLAQFFHSTFFAIQEIFLDLAPTPPPLLLIEVLTISTMIGWVVRAMIGTIFRGTLTLLQVHVSYLDKIVGYKPG